MPKRVKHFCDDESGATAIVYGLIAALVSVAAIGALTTMGNTLQGIVTLTGASHSLANSDPSSSRHARALPSVEWFEAACSWIV